MAQIKLESIKPSGTLLYHLTFSVPDEIASSFKTPGQYVVMSEGEQKGFFAIASAPGGNTMEFLIKSQGDYAEKLCQMQPGDTVEATEAQGNGFDVAAASGKDVHMFSMGSGIAPFRSLILWKIAGNGDFKSLCLWQASFTKDHLPFAEEYGGWSGNGITVNECLDEATGKNIHDMLADTKPDMASAMCFFIGSKEFGEAIAKTAADLGVSGDHLKSNY